MCILSFLRRWLQKPTNSREKSFSSVKSQQAILFSSDLLFPDLNPSKDEVRRDRTYELQSAVIHIECGNGPNSGHYVTLMSVSLPQSRIHMLDDDRIYMSDQTLDVALNNLPESWSIYLLFYKETSN
jgi:hypothetical protein